MEWNKFPSFQLLFYCPVLQTSRFLFMQINLTCSKACIWPLKTEQKSNSKQWRKLTGVSDVDTNWKRYQYKKLLTKGTRGNKYIQRALLSGKITSFSSLIKLPLQIPLYRLADRSNAPKVDWGILITETETCPLNKHLLWLANRRNST